MHVFSLFIFLLLFLVYPSVVWIFLLFQGWAYAQGYQFKRIFCACILKRLWFSCNILRKIEVLLFMPLLMAWLMGKIGGIQPANAIGVLLLILVLTTARVVLSTYFIWCQCIPLDMLTLICLLLCSLAHSFVGFGCLMHQFIICRYRVKLNVSDATSVAVFVMFDGDMKNLLDLPCSSLVFVAKVCLLLLVYLYMSCFDFSTLF